MIKFKTLELFQQDLRNGMTITDACNKHRITFKYACENLPKAYKRNRRSRKQAFTRTKFIQERNGKFYVRKYLPTSKKKGKTVSFGTYSSLEDAMKIRDHCVKYGWKQQSVDEYCRVLGVERCKNHRKNKVRYH